MSERGEDVNATADPQATAVKTRVAPATDGPEATRAVPRAIMYAYPWDLYEHGVDRALDDLESCGIDAVQLSFSYHVATFLTPRAASGRVRFGEHGEVQFDPGVLAGDWPLEPPVAAHVSGPDYIAALLAAIASRGLTTLAWVVYLYNHVLARRRPDLCVQNAFGDRHGAQLCPANPTVRAYVGALTSAVLTHQPLSGLVVESLSFLPYDYGFLNLKAAVRPSSSAGLLLSLCFCGSCRERAADAGLDAETLRRRVVQVVDAELALLPDGQGAADGTLEWVSRDAALHDYLSLRTATASALQREVLATVRARGLRSGSNSAEGQDERVTGVPNDTLRDLRSEYRFEVLPHRSGAELSRIVASARAAAGPNVPLYALAQLSAFDSEASFRSTLAAVKELGVDRFRLYEYGLLTTRQLEWLKRNKDLWTGDPRGAGAFGPGRDGH